MKCPVCQKEIDNDSLFCEYCGAKLKKENKNGKKINILIVSSLLIICVIILIGYRISYFSEPESIEMGNGYDVIIEDTRAIDLGLSVKWASCNVGATRPEQYGDYFAWGEVEPKTTYDWSTYKHCNGSPTTLTKYCNNRNYGNKGFTDNKTVLALEDDVAHVNWGGAWRMPTKAEQDELRTKCKWVWTTLNGVNGYKVIGPNGNSIFLPAAGYMNGGTLYSAGSYGYYWSSSLGTDSPSYAYRVYFNSGFVDWFSNDRYYGPSVRPVCK